MLSRSLTVAALLVLPLTAQAQPKAGTPEQIEFFEKRIRPLLVNHCYECHSQAAKKVRGELLLDTREGLRNGGITGPSLIPGQPDKSLLMKAVGHEDKDLKMPPKQKLSAAEIADLAAWIKMGAPDPRDGKVAGGVGKPRVIDITQGKKFWSFQPLKVVAPPLVKDPSWPLNPVDHFILAPLEARGLKPVPQAERLALLRRATIDLTGLPPTPREIDLFLNDASPQAYEKLIERLLASPAYGERWGRYWLDVVRYADTAGDNSDYPIPQMIKYRDWVINAFNRDQPYDQFVREQLAGDLMPSVSEQDRKAKLIATGYLANARRFGSYEDKRYPWNLTIDDAIDNLGKAFLGLTMACARCHDHKFDPLLAEDYYGLYGFFSSTRFPWPGIELDRVQRDLVPLGPSKELAYAVIDGKNEPKKRIGQVGNAKVQLKGDPDYPGKEVARRFPLVLGGQELPKDAKGSGRLELTTWITDPANPLTARVLVNRLWHYHFGKGLVATPNDFGKQGKAPTHPELLDYLAQRFMDGGWSIKNMHRLIMLSRTYQLSSQEDDANRKADTDNDLLWHYPRRRLDAEAIRDSLLVLGGNLDRSPGGPHPFPEEKKWNFTQHNPFKAIYDNQRRSVYLMTQRIQRHPFLALFDGPDTSTSTATRPISTTTLQALFLMNDPFVHSQAQKFAGRLLRDQADEPARIDQAFRWSFGRPPSQGEREQASSYLTQAAESLRKAGVPSAQVEARAWESLTRALFMSNEFVYVN